MSHDHGKLRSQHDEYVPSPALKRDAPNADQALVDDPEKTFGVIEVFANGGKGDARTLLHLAKALTWDYKVKVRDLLEKVSKRVSGDDLMQLGEIVGESVDVTLNVALHSRPALTDEQLKRHLQQLSADQLAALDADEKMFREVRKRMPGALMHELPQLATLPTPVHGRPHFVKWLLEGDKTVAAVTLARAGSGDLAKSLDGLKAWAWLDNLHLSKNFYAMQGLETLRDATTDADVKAKINKMVGAPKTDAEATADANTAREDVGKIAASHGDVNALLDAGDRATYIEESDKDDVVKRLRGESAAILFEFLIASGFDLPRSIPLLSNARGATAEQMRFLFTGGPVRSRVAALADDRLRAQVRKVLGPRVPLSHLFPDIDERQSAHEPVYKDEALRQWAYQEKNPETNLWLAAGSNHAAEACKLVRREVGYGWVTQLPATAPNVELRRFALNCGDERTASWVHSHLFGDRTYKIDPSESTIGPKPGDLTGNRADDRLQDAARQKEADPKAVLERLGDLDAEQRSAALRSPAEMKMVFGDLFGEDVVRAVFLLGPSIPQLFSLPIRNEPGVLDYLRTRPQAEEHQALARPDLLTQARTLFLRTGPFLVFPSLRDPQLLAKALEQSPDLLEWILEETDPSFALARLSTEPVRKVAVAIFEERPHIYDKLPAYKHLLPQGKRGFEALEKSVKDEETEGDAKSYKAGDVKVDGVADRHAERMQDASGQGHLWFALESLAKQHGSEESALALVDNAAPAERVALLDGTHTTSVDALRQMVQRSPIHVFPGLSLAQLLALPDAAKWLFAAEPAYALLSRLNPGGPAFVQLANALDGDGYLASIWLGGLPDSAALTVHERVSLDALAKQLKNEDLLRELFKVRYGAVVDATFGGDELKKMWGVLARLPPGQVNQHVIRTFTHGAIGKEALGEWYRGNVILDETPHGLDGNEKSYEDAAVLSKAEVQKYYGLDDNGLATASGKDGWIQQVAGGYQVKPITTTPQFTATVLHEVGHSVDQMLGEHTEMIYGQGGWRTYGVDQFEEWATEMGALKGVTGRDRQDVIAAWKESLRAGKPVSEMVDPSHAAMKLPRADDPLVKAANAGHRFNYKESRHEDHGGKVFVTNGVTLATVPKATADVAPSEYSMSAPAEYFAECYVEYYREYLGTPETEKNKGGHLAGWIKQFFDANVDKARLSPDRISGAPTPTKQPKPTR